MRFYQCGQFLHDIVMHLIMMRPWLLGGVQIKPGAETEIPSLVCIVRNIRTAWAGVRGNDNQTKLGSHAHRTGLLHEVLIGAGQPGQPVQHWQLAALLRLRRQVHGEDHVAIKHFGAMAITLVPATETLLTGNVFQIHSTSAASCELQAARGNCACLQLVACSLPLLLRNE